ATVLHQPVHRGKTAMPAITAAAAYRGGKSPGGRRRRLRSRPAWSLALLVALAALGPAQGPAQAATKASHFVLDNGLQVVVVPNTRLPIVTQQVWYKVGAAEDPSGQPGLAHFLEHLMFKGTERFPDNYFERFSVANGGASINAFTTQAYTIYPQSLPKR